MPIRPVVLSGFGSSDQSGKIMIESGILTVAANNATAQGRLSWEDVRFLDRSFRDAPSTYVLSNVAYLRDSNLQASAGRHLFSILTGRHIYPGPGEAVFRIMASKPRLTVKTGMSFPNEQSLFGYQVDSDYGKLCRGWILHLKYNEHLPSMTIKRLLDNYERIITNSTLCQIDKSDVFALCVLHAWASKRLTAPFRSYTFPDFPLPPAQLKSLLTIGSCRQTPLDIGRSVPGFGAAFPMSLSYGVGSFPDYP